MVMAAEAGITPDVFRWLTYRELANYLKGYGDRMTSEWKRARLIAYMTYIANSTKPVSIEEFFPLDGDKVKRQDQRPLMTKDEYERLKKAWN